MYVLADTCRCWSPLSFERNHCLRCGKDLQVEPENIRDLIAWEELWIAVEKTRYEMIEAGDFDLAYVEDGLAAVFDELADALIEADAGRTWTPADMALAEEKGPRVQAAIAR